MKIKQEIKDFFAQVPVMALATVDLNGIPNVSAIASKKIVSDDTIYTIDTFHKKTLENIKQNAHISIALWKDAVGYQIKGTATHYTQGAVFEEAKSWILVLKPKKIVKGVIVIKVTDVFCLTPNYGIAGEKC